jgi:hypothetical protein
VIGERSDLDMENCILWSSYGSGFWFDPGKAPRSVRLVRCTFSTHCYLTVQTAAGFPIQVEAEGNIFSRGRLLDLGYDTADDALGPFTWHGRDNLYGVEHAAWVRQRRKGNWFDLAKDLAGWNKLWGREEPGTRAVPRVPFAWDAARHLRLEEAVPWLRKTTAEVGAGVGPDWELVGPGPAYVRALAAAGKPVPAAALRPEAPAGGPFVLLRVGREVRGFVTLQEAADAAANGDTIELRTDGPCAGCEFRAKVGLVFRAAPGYRPVVEGSLTCLDSALAAVEGIVFRRGGVRTGFTASTLARLANCVFELPEPRDSFLGATEIVNCFVPGEVTVTVQPGEEWTFKNSVLGGVVNQGCPRQGEAPCTIERCILWAPAGAVLSSHPTGCKVRLRVQRTLLESGAPEMLTNNLADLAACCAGYHGSGNVYRLGLPGVLAALRARFASPEEDSREAEPLIHNPRMWRLLDRVGDRDYGADVERIARSAGPPRP